jgi:hypothetical protein
MKKYALLLLFPAVLFLAGCGGKTGSITGSASYPELYSAEKLPQYKDAKLVQVMKNGPTLKDGVLLRLESAKDIKTISAYFDEEMTKLGWIMPAVNTPTETSYATQYNKEDKYLQLTVSQITGSSQTITINLMQK